MTPKVFERTYQELKWEVTSGRYKPGQRLQARSLADVLKTSTSPVINAMRQLVGEHVLEYTHDDGFIIPWVNEQRLRDLLSWSAWLPCAGADMYDGATEIGPDPFPLPMDIVAATEQLFLAIVSRVRNAELTRNVENSNDRLRALRGLEHGLIADRIDELTHLHRLRQEGNRRPLLGAISRYYRRRMELIPQLIGLSYHDRH